MAQQRPRAMAALGVNSNRRRRLARLHDFRRVRAAPFAVLGRPVARGRMRASRVKPLGGCCASDGPGVRDFKHLTLWPLNFSRTTRRSLACAN